MKEKNINIEIPMELYHKIENRIKEKGTESAADFIIRTLEEKMGETPPASDEISQDDEEKIKERLKALGYMD